MRIAMIPMVVTNILFLLKYKIMNRPSLIIVDPLTNL